MKKRELNSLRLNKVSILSFEIENVKGGLVPLKASGYQTCGGQTSSYPTTVTG
jgi:hypothetical protein